MRDDQLEKLVVVDAWQTCPCHTILTLRRRNDRYWVNLFVKCPPDITFGDVILSASNADGIFGQEPFWLDRGPRLRFKLKPCDFPRDILTYQLNTSPAITMVDGDDDTFLFLI